MAPSATKRHSANLWIAPSSSLGLAKTYDSVFPTRVKALAIMVQSSSVPKRSIMTPPSPGKRPKSFTALNTARFASRKSAKCSGNGEVVAGFCASLCSRPRPIARLRRGGAITGKRHTCCATLNQLAAKELLQAYFDRWQIEINHRDEKNILGVGHAQVWAELSLPRVPALMVAAYSLMLLSALETYGPTRTTAYFDFVIFGLNFCRGFC